ncbi:MAG TPA: glycosyltransferase, partial [Puia sp.]|nr:glycosyltransferase [Puia sp.]
TEKPFDRSKREEVKQFLSQERIDLVHAHGTRACSNVLGPARSLKIPVIYTVHGWSFHPDQPFLTRTLRTMGERYLTSRAAVNISVSSSNRQTGVDRLGKFDARVINNGIDRDKFDPARIFPDVRKELGIPRDAVLVLFIARFTSHKQPLSLIEAFRRAMPDLPNMYLLLVGEGDQKAEAVRIVGESGLQDKIRFQPFRQDVPDILAAADIFVLPSLWEGLPIGLLEAMAMGKAVIATDVDGTKEVVQNDQNGLLVKAGDVPALAKSLLFMGGNESRRKEFGRKARETVRLKFDAAAMTREIEEVYYDVLKKDKKVVHL